MKLQVNEHVVERLLRVVIGFAVLALAFVGPKSPWAYLGLLPLLTGAVGICPLYSVLGIGTAKAGAPLPPG